MTTPLMPISFSLGILLGLLMDRPDLLPNVSEISQNFKKKKKTKLQATLFYYLPHIFIFPVV